MDFGLTEEQQLLRDVTREVLSRNYDIGRYNEVIGGELGWSREVWGQLAEVGLLGLGFDRAEAGQIEIMVIMTEVGRRLTPEPVAQAALIPGGLIAEVVDGLSRNGPDGDAQVEQSVRRRVSELCEKFPVYPGRN